MSRTDVLRLAVALGVAASAAAQDWPSRALHLVVPYPPGAGGNIGAEFVAKSAPDGYTLVMGAVATHAINPALYRNLPYDPVRDFRHIALLVQVPNVLVVNNDLPARTVAELIGLAKAQPGKLDFASGSTGSTGHLAGERASCRSCRRSTNRA